MNNGQSVLIHSLTPPPAEVHTLLKERGFSIHTSRSWKEAERAYSALDQIRYILVDITLCCGYGWDNFIGRVKTGPSSGVLIFFHPKFPHSLYNLLDHSLAAGNSNVPDCNEIAENSQAPLVVGENQKLLEAIKLANRYACHDITVLITGETGTGKDVISRYIHAHSSRKDGTFVACNVTAIPETLVESELFGYIKGAFTGADKDKRGLIEAAEGGTLFLDEIGDLAAPIQIKLLRFLESREYYKVGGTSPKIANVRIIASTNRELNVPTSEFRQDLYYRVNSARIMLPPLRERGDDITLLAENFIENACRQSQIPLKKISSSVKALFLNYPWPGNIRELKNTIESAVMVSDDKFLSLVDLPGEIREWLWNAEGLSQNVQNPLLSALNSTNWNITKAARKLHWSRMTVYRKMAKYHISRKKNCNISAISQLQNGVTFRTTFRSHAAG